MKFDTEKLKKMARPMSDAEREELEYREDNREWFALSEKLALKVRYLLRTKNISPIELASRMDVSTALVSKILSGKENIGFKTIGKLEKALGNKLVDIDTEEKTEGYSISQKMYDKWLYSFNLEKIFVSLPYAYK